MKTYISYFMDENGKRHFGCLKAQDRVQCCVCLAARRLVPMGVWALPFSGYLFRGGLSGRHLALFFTQLAMALSSGVSMMDALHYMEKEQTNERMRALLVRIKEGVMNGRTFSSCMLAERGIPMMIGKWLEIGEKQGRFIQVLESVANHLQKEAQMKKQLQQQLLYPSVVLGAIVCVGLFLIFVVMPTMARQLIGAGSEGTGVMRIFLVIHDFFAAYGMVFLGTIMMAILVGIVYSFYKEKTGKYRDFFKGWVLRFPLLKKIFVLKVYVPFARFLGQMLSSGIPADEAVQMVEGYFTRSIFACEIAQVKVILAQGGSLSLAISEVVFVPELAKQMLFHGERYGRMSETLLNSAEYYERTLLEELGLIIRFVEPLAVALLGVLVLLMALGLFLPVLDAYRLILTQ